MTSHSSETFLRGPRSERENSSSKCRRSSAFIERSGSINRTITQSWGKYGCLDARDLREDRCFTISEQNVTLFQANGCFNPDDISRNPAHVSDAPKIGSVGMKLGPEDPGQFGFCHVERVHEGGALAEDGRVQVGDRLRYVDDFYCEGVKLFEIKRKVQGPAGSLVSLVFDRTGLNKLIRVTIRRKAAAAAVATASSMDPTSFQSQSRAGSYSATVGGKSGFENPGAAILRVPLGGAPWLTAATCRRSRAQTIPWR